MSDNSRKFLWLAVAVSAFTLIVLGAAFLIFSVPKSSGQAPFSLGKKAEPRSAQPDDYLADLPAETPSSDTTGSTPAGDIVIVYGNDPNSQTGGTQPAAPASTTIIVAPPAQPAASTAPAAASPPPAATSAAKPAVSQAPVPAKTTAPAPSPAPAATATTPAARTATKPATQPPAAAAPAAKAATPPAGDFWIQAGSFSVKDNADALKSTIQARSLPAVVGVKDINGKSYYTVKIGPYHSREEATKWLSAVKAVEGAGKSFVTQ
jgi:DedD protein